jgi:flagellar basal-body rod modification protein FlgD
MQINALAQTTSTGSTGSTANSQATNDMFLQLLMAQLKSQSPLEPLDPNQFVGQLTQFNMLDQLTQIRELLQNATTTPPSSKSTQGGH